MMGYCVAEYVILRRNEIDIGKGSMVGKISEILQRRRVQLATTAVNNYIENFTLTESFHSDSDDPSIIRSNKVWISTFAYCHS